MSLYKHLYEDIYNVPILFYNPFAMFLFMHALRAYFANFAKLPMSKLSLLLSSKGERSNIYVGLVATTPHYG